MPGIRRPTAVSTNDLSNIAIAEFEIPNAQEESLWIWEGRRWVQDQYFYMIAQLKRYDAKRYLYREWNKISHELLTDAVCENRPQE